jgi:hypothetical protein
VEIGILLFQRQIVSQDFTGHLGIAMKRRPMQRRRAMLPQRIHRQSGCQHQAHGGHVVVPCGMRHLLALLRRQPPGQARMRREQ